MGYLSLLGDIQKVVPCSDADKPVGSCGAWRGVCYNRKRQVCTCFYIYTHTKLTLVYLLRIYLKIITPNAGALVLIDKLTGERQSGLTRMLVPIESNFFFPSFFYLIISPNSAVLSV